jgi:uncharacterized peroxidase-related enzyme
MGKLEQRGKTMTIEVKTNDKFTWLEMPGENVTDERMQKLFARAKQALGFVPNVFLGFTIRPTHFTHWYAHFKELTMGESELSRADREMIGVVVSAQNQCLYCLVSHGADLRAALEDPILGDRIAFDYRRAGLNERTLAMLDYAVKITNTPVECEEADVQKLRDLGYSEVAIFDIAETAAMYNFTNRLASATGMLPNREYHSMAR